MDIFLFSQTSKVLFFKICKFCSPLNLSIFFSTRPGLFWCLSRFITRQNQKKIRKVNFKNQENIYVNFSQAALMSNTSMSDCIETVNLSRENAPIPLDLVRDDFFILIKIFHLNFFIL